MVVFIEFLLVVDVEIINLFEVGVKLDLLDDMLCLNVVVFFYIVDDM